MVYEIVTLRNGHRFAKFNGKLIPNQGRLAPYQIATDEEIALNFQDWQNGGCKPEDRYDACK